LERYVVIHEQNTWWVKHQDRALDSFENREQAEKAALAAADRAARSGKAVSVLIVPPDASQYVRRSTT